MSSRSAIVIVSESLARGFWPGQDAVGRRIRLGDATNTWLTIVGVVGDVKYRRLPENPDGDPDIYLPFDDRNSQVAIAVRTALTPESISGSVRAAVRSADASIAVFGVAPMEQLIARQTAPWRFVMWLMGAFGGIALLMALVGIYGVLSYMVNQRTSEIGVRMALGADRLSVLGLVLRQSCVLVVVGLGVGLGGAAAVARSLRSMMFGVTTADPLTFAAVSLIFGGVAILASYLPAVRATKVDPLTALRCD